ncbi:MAG TPA: hypothetical protein ENK19_06975 [Acidobacteria bacterium]|nr:hypothetical protein [Acidobacteriota bacterium]
MTGPMVAALALASGWGWVRLLDGEEELAGRIAGAAALAAVLTGGWLAVLDVAGVRWTFPAVAAGWLPGIVLTVWPGLRRSTEAERPSGEPDHDGPPSLWWVLAALGVGARVLMVAAVPAFGWDFRYIWGLKARVFALAGGHDLGWLAQPVHTFAHPDYPPLWSDLVASLVIAGTPAGVAAAAWGALITLGIGAACWKLARPAGRPLAALAAVVGAWFPTLLAPDISHSGLAEPLAALLFAVALAALERTDGSSGAAGLAAAALAGLAVTKNEGSVLALLMLACFLPRSNIRHRLWLAMAVVGPLAVWQVTVAAAGVPRLPALFDAARMAARAMRFPGAVLSAATAGLVLEIVLYAIVLANPVSGGRRLKVVLALWLGVLGAAYLVLPHGLLWRVETSLERVLAIPLPGAFALALGSGFGGSPGPASRAVDTGPRDQHNAGSAGGREEAT